MAFWGNQTKAIWCMEHPELLVLKSQRSTCDLRQKGCSLDFSLAEVSPLKNEDSNVYLAGLRSLNKIAVKLLTPKQSVNSVFLSYGQISVIKISQDKDQYE